MRIGISDSLDCFLGEVSINIVDDNSSTSVSQCLSISPSYSSSTSRDNGHFPIELHRDVLLSMIIGTRILKPFDHHAVRYHAGKGLVDKIVLFYRRTCFCQHTYYLGCEAACGKGNNLRT